MTYLDLVNKVLDRLREERVQASQVDSNPYYRSIGAHVNDAKQEVENSWQWTQLRQVDSVPVEQSQTVVVLPNSADNNYVIHRIKVLNAVDGTTAGYLRWRSDDQLWKYNLSDNVQENVPAWYATGFPNDPTTGNQVIELFPPANDDYVLEITSWHNSEDLVAADDKLLVPSLPVYSLATALASRERGETGAINTGELFMQAQKHLADAIAYDSARMPEELDWYADDRLFNTNVRTA